MFKKGDLVVQCHLVKEARIGIIKRVPECDPGEYQDYEVLFGESVERVPEYTLMLVVNQDMWEVHRAT